MRMRGLVAVLGAGIIVSARPATAQEIKPDSAGIPADTVRLRTTRVPGLDRCDPWEFRVVDDTAEAARLREQPGCRDADLGSLADRTLVGMPLGGDCLARYRVDAWRSEARREYRILATTWYGGCRAVGRGYFWIALPKLPPGWRVSATQQGLDGRDDGELADPRWSPEELLLPQPGDSAASPRRPR